jgi:subtilisin family serine protease
VLIEFAPGQKAAVKGALLSAKGSIHHEFDKWNTLAVTLSASGLDRMRRTANVRSIEPDAPRYPMSDDGQTTPWGIDRVQAPLVWEAGYDGSGVLVCIIDSGLYTGHLDFDGVNILGGYPDSGGEMQWNRDYFGHGTHVAGTIAAKHNDFGVVGVTPGTVSLYIVKVFGDDGLWAYSSDLADAAYRCADAGANIISMSLGGGSPTKVERLAFYDVYQQGILSVAAAGNDAGNSHHYPASLDSVISVAATIAKDNEVAEFSQQNHQVELAAPGVDVLSTVPYLATNELTVGDVTYQANHIEYSPTDLTVSGVLVDGGLCDSTGDWADGVVLCERGDISFYDKVMNVQASGAAAAVIYNNEPGDFLGTLGEGNTSEIVAISLSQADGQYLMANELGELGTVFSELSIPDSGYESWQGTSMATPHVSAVAALLWSSNPHRWTNVQIREAMDATALDLGEPGRDRAYGFGLVQAAAALEYLENMGPGNGPRK